MFLFGHSFNFKTFNVRLTNVEVDILKVLEPRNPEMVLVLIGVQKIWFSGRDKVW